MHKNLNFIGLYVKSIHTVKTRILNIDYDIMKTYLTDLGG